MTYPLALSQGQGSPTGPLLRVIHEALTPLKKKCRKPRCIGQGLGGPEPQVAASDRLLHLWKLLPAVLGLLFLVLTALTQGKTSDSTVSRTHSNLSPTRHLTCPLDSVERKKMGQRGKGPSTTSGLKSSL